MLAVAVLVCAYFLSKDAKRFGFDPDVILDLFFWLVVSGIIGARLFFIVANITFFIDHPSEAIMIQNGGLSWQGGLILAIAVFFLFAKKKGLKPGRTLDLIAPYVALGQSIGRIGCFLNGCCFGKPVSWGIYFPVHLDHLHPTQLYMSASMLLLFFILKQVQKRSQYEGQTFISYLIYASLIRFFIEFFRADHTTFYGLSPYQQICILLTLGALYAGTRIRNRSRRS